MYTLFYNAIVNHSVNHTAPLASVCWLETAECVSRHREGSVHSRDRPADRRNRSGSASRRLYNSPTGGSPLVETPYTGDPLGSGRTTCPERGSVTCQTSFKKGSASSEVCDIITPWRGPVTITAAAASCSGSSARLTAWRLAGGGLPISCLSIRLSC